MFLPLPTSMWCASDSASLVPSPNLATLPFLRAVLLCKSFFDSPSPPHFSIKLSNDWSPRHILICQDWVFLPHSWVNRLTGAIVGLSRGREFYFPTPDSNLTFYLKLATSTQLTNQQMNKHRQTKYQRQLQIAVSPLRHLTLLLVKFGFDFAPIKVLEFLELKMGYFTTECNSYFRRK